MFKFKIQDGSLYLFGIDVNGFDSNNGVEVFIDEAEYMEQYLRGIVAELKAFPVQRKKDIARMEESVGNCDKHKAIAEERLRSLKRLSS